MDKALADKTTIVIQEAEKQIPEPGQGRRDPEILADLFAPEVVLPEQMLAGARRDSYASGEKALMLAVLEDGIRTFLKHAQATFGRGLNLRRETLGWMMAAEARDVFAFESICETLGINAERLRRRILTASTDENILQSLQ